jgi:predicted RNase H-like nuclease
VKVIQTFIGIDLAWNTEAKHSGVVVLRGDDRAVRLVAVAEGLKSRAGVAHFVARHLAPTSVIAIDASLVVPNDAGQRLCEGLVSRAFGGFGASCHSTNRGRPYWDAGTLLLAALGTHGVRHEFELGSAKGRTGKWAFEVYPHPAMVRLFGLDRILRYKKGPVTDRREELRSLVAHLRGLPALKSSPELEALLGRDVEGLRGEMLKQFEDCLDALFCAYLAWHCWRWGAEKNEMFGTLREGYIVVPRGHVQ